MESASMSPAAEWRMRLSPLVVAWLPIGELAVRTPSTYEALESSHEVVTSAETEPTGSAPTIAASSIAVCASWVTSRVTSVSTAHCSPSPSAVGCISGLPTTPQAPSSPSARCTTPRFAALEPVCTIGRSAPSSPGTGAV